MTGVSPRNTMANGSHPIGMSTGPARMASTGASLAVICHCPICVAGMTGSLILSSVCFDYFDDFGVDKVVFAYDCGELRDSPHIRHESFHSQPHFARNRILACCGLSGEHTEHRTDYLNLLLRGSELEDTRSLVERQFRESVRLADIVWFRHCRLHSRGKPCREGRSRPHSTVQECRV